MSYTCALTGHRDLPADFDKNALMDALEEEILKGADEFLCGMARGFDLVALDCLVALKKRYNIRLVACIPFEGQERKFIPEEREMYRRLLAECDEKHVIKDGYRKNCFIFRDMYMVDRADAVFAYCTRKKGGTVYTIEYAEKHDIPVRRFSYTA